jgi:hypothetical protein
VDFGYKLAKVSGVTVYQKDQKRVKSGFVDWNLTTFNPSPQEKDPISRPQDLGC